VADFDRCARDIIRSLRVHLPETTVSWVDAFHERHRLGLFAQWDSRMGAPPLKQDSTDFDLRSGDRLQLKGLQFEIDSLVGSGAEHTVYEVRDRDGWKGILKIAKSPTKQKMTEYEALKSSGLAVLPIEQVAQGYFLVPRYDETGFDALIRILDSKTHSGVLEHIIVLYERYQKAPILVTDLRLDNLGRIGATWSIGDWVLVKSLAVGEGKAADLVEAGKKKNQQLSEEIAWSFIWAILWHSTKRVSLIENGFRDRLVIAMRLFITRLKLSEIKGTSQDERLHPKLVDLLVQAEHDFISLQSKWVNYLSEITK
jgi:hypothetical protein